MILVDTSVWVRQLCEGAARFAAAQERAELLTHPRVIGELACGRLADPVTVLGLLRTLPSSAWPESPRSEIVAAAVADVPEARANCRHVLHAAVLVRARAAASAPCSAGSGRVSGRFHRVLGDPPATS